MIPDLSTSTDVIVDQTANAPMIPRSAVESKDNSWFVQVKHGDRYETREVKLGIHDHVSAAVLEGLREGEESRWIGRPPLRW